MTFLFDVYLQVYLDAVRHASIETNPLLQNMSKQMSKWKHDQIKHKHSRRQLL
jgi:hypothetical protein